MGIIISLLIIVAAVIGGLIYASLFTRSVGYFYQSTSHGKTQLIFKQRSCRQPGVLPYLIWTTARYLFLIAFLVALYFIAHVLINFLFCIIAFCTAFWLFILTNRKLQNP